MAGKWLGQSSSRFHIRDLFLRSTLMLTSSSLGLLPLCYILFGSSFYNYMCLWSVLSVLPCCLWPYRVTTRIPAGPPSCSHRQVWVWGPVLELGSQPVWSPPSPTPISLICCANIFPDKMLGRKIIRVLPPLSNF